MLRKLHGLCIGLGLTTGACDLASAGEANVDRDGAILYSEDGRFSLEIPPGALESPATIKIHDGQCEGLGVRRLGPCYTVSPRGLDFLLPVTVSFEASDDPALAVPTDDLAVAVERDDQWRFLADRHVNEEDAVVQGSTGYLSSFALVRR